MVFLICRCFNFACVSWTEIENKWNSLIWTRVFSTSSLILFSWKNKDNGQFEITWREIVEPINVLLFQMNSWLKKFELRKNKNDVVSSVL